MSGFSEQWLTLREAADHRARSPELDRQLLRWRREWELLRVVDLGSGTGSNLRHLLPRLEGRQHWQLIDHDPRLLEAVAQRTRPWALEQGLALTEEGGGLELAGEGLAARVEVRRQDLATGVEIPPDTHLVTASALLDLTSRHWLEGLALACRRADCAVLMVLSYDGLIRWQPALEDDVLVRSLLNRHQQQDKGFGPALGPGAWEALAEALEDQGYRVTTAPSNWQIEPDDRALQEALVLDWAAAATQLEPRWALRLEQWRGQRLAWIGEGHSRLRVGHMDLLGLP